MKVGLGTSIAVSPARCAIIARTNVVLPAPRSPDSATKSPGLSRFARSTARRRVASSSANAIENSPGRGFDCFNACAAMTYSAALREAAAAAGKMHITVVPSPGTDSMLTLPPCSSTNERTIERPSPAPRWRVPWVSDSNQSNTLSFHLARNPRPVIADREDHGSAARNGGEHDGPAGRREADRIGQQIEQNLADALLVGDEGCRCRAARLMSSRMLFLTSRSCTPSAAASMVARISTGSSSSCMAPAPIEARSRMLSMIASSALLEAVM